MLKIVADVGDPIPGWVEALGIAFVAVIVIWSARKKPK
jgi:hypothetical protein